MNKLFRQLVFFGLFFGAIGCGAALFKPEVDIGVVNSTAHDITDVYIRFGQNGCRWKVVRPTFSAIYGLFRHPIRNEAEVSWNQAGKKRVETVSIKDVYPGRKDGLLMFSVFEDRVTVSFEARN